MGTLAVRLGVPVIKASKGLAPSSHFPVGFRLPVDRARQGAARHAWRTSSSPGGLLPRGPHQNRTRRFPPSGSSADVAHGDAPQIRTRIRGTGRGYRANNATNLGQGSTTFRMSGDMSPDVNAPVMGPFESSHQHGPPLLGRVRGPTRSPTSSLVCSPPTPALPSAAAPGGPGPVAYPVPRATRRKKGPSPGARCLGRPLPACRRLRPRWVRVSACPSRRDLFAFRLHNALGTQNERYFVAVTPTAHSLACLRIGVFVTADAARLATGVGGSPFTGRVSHPLDGKQSFMTSPHRHSPLTSLAWSHHATTPHSRRAHMRGSHTDLPICRVEELHDSRDPRILTSGRPSVARPAAPLAVLRA